MMYFLVGLFSGLIGFIAGFLVCRNNIRKLEETIDELKKKADAVKEVIKE